MNKGNSKAIERAVRKSEGAQYCGSGVTPVEGPWVKSTLEGKRAGSNRDLSRHGHKTEKDSVVIRARPAQAI